MKGNVEPPERKSPKKLQKERQIPNENICGWIYKDLQYTQLKIKTFTDLERQNRREERKKIQLDIRYFSQTTTLPIRDKGRRIKNCQILQL